MSNVAYHRCQCGYETDVSNANSLFDTDIHCRQVSPDFRFCPRWTDFLLQCGLSASESDTKIGSELASMMAGFNIDTIKNQAHDISMTPTPQVVPPMAYITQHYTHSAHILPQHHQGVSVSDTLVGAGVDASALLPSQIELFRDAQPDQQARLIELWRIAPLTHANDSVAKPMNTWPSISVEMEKRPAKSRWDWAEQEKVKNLCAPQGARDAAEPYITNGYQNLAYVPYVHLVSQHNTGDDNEQAAQHNGIFPHDGSREWWRRSEGEPMEHQYGMQQQMQMQNLPLDVQDEQML